MKFYHLTTAKALPAILEHGLDPEKSESSLEAIFLSNTQNIAEDYEAMRNEPCVLLEVNINPDEYELGPDNYELHDFLNSMSEEELEEHGLYEGVNWDDCSWEQSLQFCNQVACYDIISPPNIKIIKRL